MQEYKNIILVSHCLLNELAVVKNDAGRKDNLSLIKNLMKMNVGIFQLPCPENRMYGPNRWGSVYEQFDNNFYRQTSRDLLSLIVSEISDYIKDGVNFLGVIGIDGSPSCGIGLTCKSEEFKGEISAIKDIAHCVNSVEMTDDKGVFMEELEKLFEDKNIESKFYGYNDRNVDEITEKIEESIKINS